MQNTWDIAHKSSQRTREAKVKYKNSQKQRCPAICSVSFILLNCNTAYCTLHTAYCILHTANFIQNTRYKIQNTKYKIQNTKYKILQISYKIQSIKPNSLQRKQHCTTVSGNLIFLRQMHKCSLQFNRRYTMYDTSKQLKAAKHCTLHLPRMFEVSNICTNKKKAVEN